VHHVVHARAPLRVSFVGGGTDFPGWYEEHGGAVLSATIDHFVHVTAQVRDDRQVRVRSLDLGHLVEYRLDEGPRFDGVMDLAKAAIHRMGVDVGVDVDILSEAPPGSGLGGSSALVVAVVAALAALDSRAYPAGELATLSHAIEREDLGIAGGLQDQYAAASGGFNLLEFSRAGVTVTPVRTDASTLLELERTLLLYYTGSVRRDVGLIDRQVDLQRAGREETLLGLKQLREMAYAMREAVEAGDVDGLGRLLGDAFEAKKRMNPHIAEGTAIEEMLAAARAAGASGGKICGAGGGGYLLVAAAPDRQGDVRATLERFGGQFARFAFHPEGVRAEHAGRVWRPGSGGAAPISSRDR